VLAAGLFEAPGQHADFAPSLGTSGIISGNAQIGGRSHFFRPGQIQPELEAEHVLRGLGIS
jgi:hypothetical protein